MKNMVGPFSMEPVRRASQRNALFTGKRMKRAQPTHAKRIHRAVRPDPAFTKATLRAKSIQPTRSLATPALRTTTPTVVSSNLSSGSQVGRRLSSHHILWTYLSRCDTERGRLWLKMRHRRRAGSVWIGYWGPRFLVQGYWIRRANPKWENHAT